MKDIQLDLMGERDPLGLTPRQRRAFEMLLDHRYDGVDAEDVGAMLHGHLDGARCSWDKDNGRGVLSELRKKGLAVNRRSKGGRWFSTEAANRERPLPMGDLPEGF